MPLGLLGSESLDDFWSQNTRRKVFYSYPNGTAPLMGFLSLADEEETPMPEFGWYEERFQRLRTLTATGPTSNTTFYLGGTTTTAGATFTPTAGTAYRIYVDDVSLFQANDQIIIHGLTINSSSAKEEVQFLITSTDTTNNFLETVAQNTASGAITNNSATAGVNLDCAVVHAGSSWAEGSQSGDGMFTFPVEVTNYTGIDKTAFEVTGNALKEPTKYDKNGAYSDELKKNGIKHMAGMEWKAWFGHRRKTTAIDPRTGKTVRRSSTGGLLWWLKQWEKGNTGNGGAFDYRVGGADLTAQTDWVTYPDKRIIRLGGATVTKAQFNRIESLPFRKTNSTEWCKVCYCGPDYLAMIQEVYEKQIQVTSLRGEQYKGWDYDLQFRTGPAGKIYYKLHPLFSDAEMNTSAFYVDMGYIKYRPVTDRDTDVKPNIQPRDADTRKDQYMTDWGLELPYPEAHMYVERLGGITL